MNDEELIARLQRTLQDRAGNIQPSPGQVPSVDFDALNAMGEPPTRPTLLNGSAGPTFERQTPEHQTAEYQLLPPTGPVPIIGRVGKAARRWPPLVGLGALAAAAAIIAAVVSLSGNSNRPVRTSPATTPVTNANPNTATSVPTSTPTSRPAQAPAPSAVPAGFQPLSITFVSADDGWTLGWRPCSTAAGKCATLAATTDGGRTWSEANAPDIAYVNNFPPFSVRFADRHDGWIYTAPDTGQPTQLWSTHDGGLTWNPVAVPIQGGTIGDLEAAGGQADMAVYGSCPAGSAGCQGQFVEEVLTSPTTSDSWVPTPVQPSVGAASVLSPSLTLWGTSGWLVDNNRTVVSGAIRPPGSDWTSWTPACSHADGAGLLAASSATDLAAVCAEGAWGTPDPGTVANHNWLFRSTDAGSTFTSVGEVPGNNPQSLTVAPGSGQTIVLADSQLGLQASFDGGHTWRTVEPGLTNNTAANPGGSFGFVGFTTANQGVAIRYTSTPTLFMTRDGGHTWSPVTF